MNSTENVGALRVENPTATDMLREFTEAFAIDTTGIPYTDNEREAREGLRRARRFDALVKSMRFVLQREALRDGRPDVLLTRMSRTMLDVCSWRTERGEPVRFEAKPLGDGTHEVSITVHDDPSAMRFPLFRFAQDVERKLRENDARKGDLGWRDLSIRTLLDMLADEVNELRRAIDNGDGLATEREACDVGAVAMMVHDLARGESPNLSGGWPLPADENPDGEVPGV